MPRRYSLPLVAVAGLAASAHAQSVDHGTRSPASPMQASPAPKPEPKPRDFVAIQHDLGRVAGALETANANPYAARERQRAEEDLESQKEMARWAKFMLAVGG